MLLQTNVATNKKKNATANKRNTTENKIYVAN